MKLKTLALLCSSAICSVAFAGNVEIYGAVDEYVAVNGTGKLLLRAAGLPLPTGALKEPKIWAMA